MFDVKNEFNPLHLNILVPCLAILTDKMAQMPALIPKEVEIQRLKKIYIMVIMLGSIAASVEVDNFVDGSLHKTAIRDSAFTQHTGGCTATS